MHQTADAAFRALADPTRRSIVALLAQQDLTIGAVAENFDMTRPAVRKHLAILEEGNLIRVEPRGRERVTRLHQPGLAAVAGWLADIDAFWTARLGRLKAEIEKGNGNA